MELGSDPDWPGHGYLWESGLPAIVAEGGSSQQQAELHHHHRRKFGSAPQFGTSPPVNASNLPRLAADLVRRARNHTQFYQHTKGNTSGGDSPPPVVFLPWGGDWTFSSNASKMFENMDKILQHVNAHSAELNATIRYSTLDHYLDIVHGGIARGGEPGDSGRSGPSALTFPVVEGDFFANDDDCCQSGLVKKVHSCWSGFFSSFPALKLALRQLDSSLRHAEMLSVMATPNASPAALGEWEAALGWGRHTQGILQHHDAITGTGGGACDVEYHLMLANATQLCRDVIANVTATLTGAPSTLGLTMAFVPPIPPATKPPNPLGPGTGKCSTHAHGHGPGGYVDCSPQPGGEAQCHKIGCCWLPSAEHPYCYKPRNETAPPTPTPLPPAAAPGWPADGTILELPRSGHHGAVAIVAVNSLAWNRTEVVTLRVRSTQPGMVLTDPAGQVVSRAQLAPPEPWNCSILGPGGHVQRHKTWQAWAAAGAATRGAEEEGMVLSRLIFRAVLPALGSVTYFLRAAATPSSSSSSSEHEEEEHTVSISKLAFQPEGGAGGVFTLRNAALSVNLSSTGLLDTATTAAAGNSGGAVLQLGQDLMLYWGNGGREAPSSNWDGSGGDGGSESDAYVFSPQGAASSLARLQSPHDDHGYWPASHPKPALQGAALWIGGPVVEEVSAAFAVGATETWQAARLYSAATDADTGADTADGGHVDLSEQGIEVAYLVAPLASNQDLVARFRTGLSQTAAILHADQAGWTERVQPPKLDYDSVQSKIGCNFHPTSAWAGIHSLAADGSLTMLTDRARAAASLSDGSLEYVLHRHATGGNGRGPSDGDPHSARGVVTIIPAADRAGFLAAQQAQPQLVLRRAHPVALLISAPLALPGKEAAPAWAKEWAPLASPLPNHIHLFGLGRRAFLQGGGHWPDYPATSTKRQGALRLQNIALPTGGSCDSPTTVDLAASFWRAGVVVGIPLGEGKLEERTLSLTRRPDQVVRRSWVGVGQLGEVRTPGGWRGGAANSSMVELNPLQIRSFVFEL